jgi:hypothetical protein
MFVFICHICKKYFKCDSVKYECLKNKGDTCYCDTCYMKLNGLSYESFKCRCYSLTSEEELAYRL